MTALCSRCHKNPVKRPAYVCAPCISKPKRRRSASSRPAGQRATAVLNRSAATTFPVASEAFYKAQPAAPAPASADSSGQGA